MATEIVELPAGTARTLRRNDDNGVTTLTLNRPKSGNSLSHRLVHELQDTLDDIRDDRSVRVVILAAAGRLLLHRPTTLNESVEAMKAPETKREATATCSHMMQSLIGLPQPVIAKVPQHRPPPPAASSWRAAIWSMPRRRPASPPPA